MPAGATGRSPGPAHRGWRSRRKVTRLRGPRRAPRACVAVWLGFSVRPENDESAADGKRPTGRGGQRGHEGQRPSEEDPADPPRYALALAGRPLDVQTEHQHWNAEAAECDPERFRALELGQRRRLVESEGVPPPLIYDLRPDVAGAALQRGGNDVHGAEGDGDPPRGLRQSNASPLGKARWFGKFSSRAPSSSARPARGASSSPCWRRSCSR